MSDCYPCRTRTQIAGAFSLPRVLDDSLPARIFVGRMSQSGRVETVTSAVSANAYSRTRTGQWRTSSMGNSIREPRTAW
jgi:hypothetical protein